MSQSQMDGNRGNIFASSSSNNASAFSNPFSSASNNDIFDHFRSDDFYLKYLYEDNFLQYNFCDNIINGLVLNCKSNEDFFNCGYDIGENNGTKIGTAHNSKYKGNEKLNQTQYNQIQAFFGGRSEKILYHITCFNYNYRFVNYWL